MSEDLKAPRYRLVGYDIGTAPDENGGWVHWTDHEAIVARLTAERDDAIRAKDCFQRMTRAHWEALCAMRNSINEYIQMPNTDSGPLFSPEDGPIYADIAERVIADLTESRAYALALEQELRDRARLTAERDAARETLRMFKSWDFIGDLQDLSVRLEQYKARAEKAEAERDAALAGAVKVKPLVWPDFRDGGTCGHPHHFQYFVTQDHHGSFWSHFDMGEHKTLDDAKAHCDQHYQRAAIQPAPEARQADLAKAWEMGRDTCGNAMDDVADNWSCGHMPPHCDCARDIEQWRLAADECRALTPPADLAARIGGE